MNDITEGIGAAIEGALLGRTVEPDHGEDGAAGHGRCANCGNRPLGTYCQHCGQKTHVHRTLSAVGHELVHGVLHLDGKFWTTLPMLVLWPGQLTRRYIEGERAKFVSPMATFLFSVFAMFAVFQMAGIASVELPPQVEAGETAEEIRAKTLAERDELNDRLARMSPSDPARAKLEEKVTGLNDMLQGMSVGERLNIEMEPNEGDAVTRIAWIDKGLIAKWKKNPALMLYKLQSNGYKFSWLLIPLSVPFVWLLFAWRRGFRAYDHTVFVTYSLSFMSLLLVAASLVSFVPVVGEQGALLLMLAPPIHLYKHLRGAYGLGRRSALWRLAVLSGFIGIVLLLFLQVLLVLGAF
jgi:hypothetical protein